MIVVYGECEMPPGLERVATQCASWPHLLAQASRASFVVIRLPRIGPADIERLRRLRACTGTCSIILVTAYDTGNARSLVRISVDEVVWEHELPDGLILALHDRNASDHLRALGRNVSGATITPALKTAVFEALTAEPPFRTVKRWAYSIHRTPRALQQAWRQQVSRQIAPRKFLDLLREIRNGERSGSGVARLAAERCLALFGGKP